jgi:FkbM family methyltransferase
MVQARSAMNRLFKVLGIRVLTVKGWSNILEVIADRDQLKNQVMLDEIDLAIVKSVIDQGVESNLNHLAEYLKNRTKSTSGFRQDLIALLFNGFKRNGTFIEVGACDGLATSNTLLLERSFGWQGILIEPAKVWHSELSKNRTSIIDLRCAWKTTGNQIQFIEKDDSCTSTVLGADKTSGADDKVYWVETVTLDEVLQENEVIRQVDFLSVDTEGSELEVLSGFPFERFAPNFICIEHNFEEPKRSDIRKLLEMKGYSIFLESQSFVDDWFVLYT